MLEEKSAAALKPSNKECADTQNNSLVVPENKDLETERSNGERRLTKPLVRFQSLRRHSGERNGAKGGSCKKTDRTSKMLIAVLLLFLLTEFPQGIMHFLTGWYGPEFLRCKYNPWGEIWDIVALINSAINFILYCFMSKQFRTQFQSVFASIRVKQMCCNKNNAQRATTV